MMQFEAKVKQWGNSMRIILPKEVIKNESLRKEENIEIILIKNPPKVKDIFGLIKNGSFMKKNTAKIMKELREELYND